MWPDAISYLIIRVIYSYLEWTDDEGNPITEPRKVTQYRELRPTLSQAHKACWLGIDFEATNRDPLRPRFTIEDQLLKVWALKEIDGDGMAFEVVQALEKGTTAKPNAGWVELHAVATWQPAWRHPDGMLRFAAKHTYNSATKAALLAELAHRKAVRKAKKVG
jgi:hypothetical protein